MSLLSFKKNMRPEPRMRVLTIAFYLLNKHLTNFFILFIIKNCLFVCFLKKKL